ncbi:KIF-binding protein-like [Temnothorax nylanderi]|uniref:KIF-binding protein-like n=1 Tax=Temnothorax nylanderi TaxID=102681 RepID=UPI003A8A10A2
MKISKKFLDVLQLSFEIKYMNGDIAPAKKRNQSKEKKRIKAIEERMDVLYDNVIDVLTYQKFDDIVALAATYCNIGLQYVHSTELDDLNHAIHCFIRCLELLKGNRDDRKAILTSINAFNQLSLVSEKADKEVCLDKLLLLKYTAFKLYLDHTFSKTNPIHIASLVGIKEKESNPWIILTTLHHTTLQSLGLEYLKRPSSEDMYAFVLYVENMLNTRLTDMVFDKIKFDEKCLDMALTLFDLSKCFLANGHFVKAKNYIAIADYIIHKFVETRLAETAKRINCFCLSKNYIYARVISTKSWGSYGVSLLRFWMEKFSQNKDSKSSKIQDSMSELEIKFELPNSIFPALEKELKHVKTIEITETCILNLTVAKSVFEKTWSLFERVKEYFTADSNIKMYAMITLKISDAYKYLAGFEEQRDEQIKLHKRRVESLEDVRKKFRTTIEDDRELQIYKRICYEVVTSCSTVMDLMAEETYYDESFKELSMKVDQYAKIIAENINFYLNRV